MTVVFFFNYLNHHQVLVADEMYRLLGDDFRFVVTLPRNANELKGGADYSTRSYCMLAGEDGDVRAEAMALARTADVCVFGACSEDYAVVRAKEHPCGLAFQVGERWLKHGALSILSPVLRRWLLNYYRYYHKANFYKLCASAFTARDDIRLGCYKGRHYKWGYFTHVDDRSTVEAPSQGVSTTDTSHTLMWCARYLSLKHPELPMLMAARLKAKGFSFVLDMYGDGVELEHTRALAARLKVDDVVRFMGSVSNEEVLQAMRQHEIFLFTSDRNEGWGAVANESMANGCAIVASDAIGRGPYLVNDGSNGCVVKSGDVASLTEKTEWLLTHQEECMAMRRNAFRLMHDVWSPRVAAENLLRLATDLLAGRQPSIAEGPCSKA